MITTEQKVIYIQKTYQIFIRNICLKEQFDLAFISKNSGNQHSFCGETVINVNRTFSITAIDIIIQGKSKIDKDVALDVYIKELNFTSLVFDVNIQKIVKQSKTIFRKQLKNKNGYIEYKFTNCKTKLIKSDHIQKQLLKREKITLCKMKDYQNIKQQLQKKQELVKKKDMIISALNSNLNEVNKQNGELVKKLDYEFAKIKEGMNIKIKVGSNNTFGPSKNGNKQDIQIMLKEKEQRNKFLETEIKKLEIQMEIIQDFKRYATSDEKSEVHSKQKKHSLDRQNNLLITKESREFSSSQSQQSELIEQTHPLLSNPLQKGPISPIIQTKSSPNFLQTSLISQRTSKLLQKNNLNQHKVSPKVRLITIDKEAQLIAQENFIQNNFEFKNLDQSMKKQSFLEKIIQDASNINIDTLKQRLQTLKSNFQIEKNALKQENSKKTKQIEKLMKKNVQNEKNKLQFQQQKSRLLLTFANKLSLGDKDESVKMLIKQMTNFNKQIEQQKINLIKQISKVNKKFNNQMIITKKIQQKYTQCILQINQMSNQLKNYEKKCNKMMISRETITEAYSQKQIKQYEFIKNKLQQVQKELKAQMQQNHSITKQNEFFKLQLNRISIKKRKQIQYEENYNSLKNEYEHLLAFQQNLKLQLVHIENTYNETIKHDDLAGYEQQMERLLAVMYQQVSTFEKEFYAALKMTTKAVYESEAKYYQNMLKNNQAFGQSADQSQRLAIINEKQSKLTRIKLKADQLQNKIIIKMNTLEEDIKTFEEGVKIVEDKIVDLQKFKNYIYQFLRSLNLQSTQFLFAKQTNLKNSIAKSKVSIQDIQIIELEEQEEDNEQSQNNINSNELLISQIGRKSIDKLETKKSNYMQASSSKFELSKLKHSVTVKRSLLNEGLGIGMSKVFSLLKESSADMQASSIEAKKQMSLERMKIRDRQLKNFQQSSQMLKKIDMSLIDEKMDKDRIIIKYQMRERDLQKQFQKLNAQFKKKITELQEKINKNANIQARLKDEKTKIIEQKGQLINQIAEQRQYNQQTSEYLLQIQDERDSLKQQKHKLQNNIELYQKAQKELIQEFEKVKQHSKINEITLKELIQERNNKFDQLEQIHKKTMKEMKKTIQQLQLRLIEQSEQNMISKQKMDNTVMNKDEQIEYLTCKIQELQFKLENISDQYQQLLNQNHQFENQTQIWQKNILELSEEIENKQKEILRLERTIKTLHQQYKCNLRIGEQMKNKQQRYKFELNEALNSKKDQINHWEQEFIHLQSQQQKLMDLYHNYELENISLKKDRLRLSQLVKKRQNEILSIQKQLIHKQLHYKSLELQILTIRNENSNLNHEKELSTASSNIKLQLSNFGEKKTSKHHKNRGSNLSKQIKSNTNEDKHSCISIQDHFQGNISNQYPQSQHFYVRQRSQMKYQRNQQAQKFGQNSEGIQSSSSTDRDSHQLILFRQNQKLVEENRLLSIQISQKQNEQAGYASKMQQKMQQIEQLKEKIAKLESKNKQKQQNIQKLIKQLLIYEQQMNKLSKQIQKLTKTLKIKEVYKLNEEVIHKQLVQMSSQNIRYKQLISILQDKLLPQQDLLKNVQLSLPQRNKTNKIKSHLIHQQAQCILKSCQQ